eukprot:Sspe_Gene.115562::Locus_103158_Transcript_1_1_Confidence_1.000_Length_705::g.115562::m.115562
MPAQEFEFDWEAGGVVNWIATGYGKHEWRNPHTSGDVLVTMSSCSKGHPSLFVDRAFKDQVLFTDNLPFSWIQLELPVAVHPTHYRMSHRAGLPRYFLRNWAFCASFDGEDWRVLCQHTDDKTLNGENEDSLTGAWEVQTPKDEFFPYFRIVIFEKGNSDHTDALVASCFELFGAVRHREWPAGVKVTID